MLIKIAERLRPYSHIPGVYFMLPGTPLRVQIFPAHIRIHDLSGPTPALLADVSLGVKGPVEDFTAQQDLEKGELTVWGKSKEGYFRYRINALEGGAGIAFHIERAPPTGIGMRCEGEWSFREETPGLQRTCLQLGPKGVSGADRYSLPSHERLSLGSNKSQDWSLISSRMGFEEIFPLWHRLGKMIPNLDGGNRSGTACLLERCREAIAGKAPEKIVPLFTELFLAGFDFGLSPRLRDTDFNGIVPEVGSEVKGSPLCLLSEGARLIRALFVQEDADGIHLLPALPPEFHCGRFLDIDCTPFGRLNIEWTKKVIRRVTFCPTETRQVAFKFSQDITHCRLRTSYKDKGIPYTSGVPLDAVSGASYWFDNFQK